MTKMNYIFDAYDLPICDLLNFYHRLNTPIPYSDGMVVVVDTLYWGRDKHYPALRMAIPVMEQRQIERISQLLDVLHTPGKTKKFATESGIGGDTLRILKHDLALWLPKYVPLSAIEPLGQYPQAIQALTQIGITDQLELLSHAQIRSKRSALAQAANIEPEILNEITRLSDLYRSGRNLGHIRDQIYYDIGLNTWQKWAAAISEEIIASFSDYVEQHNLQAERLLPWPREVRNGIEWAKLHLSIFSVEW
jgi:hypothetical protein